MKRNIIKYLFFFLLLPCFCPLLKAREGMWMVNLLDKNLQRQMRRAGLRLNINQIYSREDVSLADAVVSLDFGCTGSLISRDGLLITNHHCAYGDIHALSTPDCNYLENGFWALNRSEEIPIKGKHAFILQKVFDISEEVSSLRDSLYAAGRLRGGGRGHRVLFAILEKKYAARYRMQAECASMWAGEKYYVFLYRMYSDIRLVAAPCVHTGNFGGDADNWDWPQHKGDFALYRIYTAPDGTPAPYDEQNVPLHPARSLTVSSKGMKEGSFAMVMGYPAFTCRYNSSYGIRHLQQVCLPVRAQAMRAHARVMLRWMEADPGIRLKYADKYFTLSNVQEMTEGELLSYIRGDVPGLRSREEAELRDWIARSADRQKRWGGVLDNLDTLYRKAAANRRSTEWLKATLNASDFVIQARRLNRLRTLQKNAGLDAVSCDTPCCREFFDFFNDSYRLWDDRPEYDWFATALRLFVENVEYRYWGPYLQERYEALGQNPEAVARYVWEHSFLAGPVKFNAFFRTRRSLEEIFEDPACLLVQSIAIRRFNRVFDDMVGTRRLNQMNGLYTRALYNMRKDKGMPQYPDANSTLRLSFGRITPLDPCDAVHTDWFSTSRGLWEKHNPDQYDYRLDSTLQDRLKAGERGIWADRRDGQLHLDFICDLDITGGNSGSPVLNARGELIGLAFDGNRESLGGNSYFDPLLNKSVCVDIRYVMWLIEYCSPAAYLLKEMDIR